jgi:CHRD domain
MRKLALAVSVALLGAVALITTALANGDGGKSFRADITGYEEIIAGPPEGGAVSTGGSGSFTAKVRKNPDRIEYRLRYEGLEGGATSQAHIHFGQRHTNGGVSAFLCGGGDKPPCTPGSGDISGTIDPADVIGPANQGIAAGQFAELIRAMRNGVTYVNIHTTPTYPGGEIRGQIKGGGGD